MALEGALVSGLSRFSVGIWRDFFALREKEIVQAMQFAHERLRLMIKPSSVVALFLNSSKSFNMSASRSA